MGFLRFRRRQSAVRRVPRPFSRSREREAVGPGLGQDVHSCGGAAGVCLDALCELSSYVREEGWCVDSGV